MDLKYDRNIVALVGLSGVGKSTLIRKISGKVRLAHFEASALIKSELRLQMQSPTSEDLRKGDIAGNQELLIRGFQRVAADARGDPIILDGHVMVDTDEGVTRIPSCVFASLGVTSFCFVQAAPAEIARRRLCDQGRVRPSRKVEEISAQQDLALTVCADIARSLSIPIAVITTEIPDLLLRVLANDP